MDSSEALALIIAQLEGIRDDIKDLNKRVSEMEKNMSFYRGAWWAAIGIAAFIGSITGAFLRKIFLGW